MTAPRTADAMAEKMAARRTPPPAPAPARELPAREQAETFKRRNVDLAPDDDARLERAVQEIAAARGWRRGNVGDVLVTLARLMLDDMDLQRRVADAVPVPKRVKHVR